MANKSLENQAQLIGDPMIIGPGQNQYGVNLGGWSEPAAPPPTTALLKLDQNQSRVDGLLLRANLPATIRLQGPADLLFRALTVKLTAKPLDRNLAKPEWGSSRGLTGESPAKQEVLFARPARVEAVGLRVASATALADVKVEYREVNSYKTYAAALSLITQIGQVLQAKPIRSGYHQQAAQADAVRLDLKDTKADLLIRSPSLPSRVAIALGDDTPAQLFPAEMEAGGTVTSRDLAGQLNAAWRRAANGGNAEVALRITSLTDGVVQVDLAGAWGRSHVGPEVALQLDGINPASLTLVTWPFAGAVDAQASLRLTGQIEGGRRASLVPGAPSFQVRTTERLEVAQAIRLANGPAPLAQREVLAIWLMLPRLPLAPERLELRLAEVAGDPAFPADEPLARAEVTLPADAAAYVTQGAGYWYRAALEQPVTLDGAQVAHPLFLVAAGRETGSLLAHRSLPISPAAANRLPTGAGAGASLVRNLERTGSWAPQSFNQQAAQWLVDLELAPTAAEAASLISLAYGAGPTQPLPLTPGRRVALESVPKLVTPPLTAKLTASVRAKLVGQLLLYKSIRD